MSDPESTPPRHAGKCQNDYLNEPPAATPSLEAMIHGRIKTEGALSFSDFMALALYEPEQGYYAKEPRQVGRGGDFFTSASVGPLFGELLARRFLAWWQQLEIQGPWRIVECGAHDGTLANDILSTLQRLNETAFNAIEYVIVEPLPRLQQAQRETLEKFSPQVKFVTSVEGLGVLPGIVFGNELLDALPFDVIEWQENSWHECRVGAEAGAFVWDVASEEISLPGLGSDFPEGYRTELRKGMRSFFEPLARVMGKSLFLWPDYGFARPDYYHPSRTEGTLRTFSKHRAAANPLESVGEIDITAHVDFTAVAEAALRLGADSLKFKNQGAWLTEVGRDWLLSLEGQVQPGLLRQFQTLTHPAHLGGSFHVLEFALNDPFAGPTSAQDLHRLAL